MTPNKKARVQIDQVLVCCGWVVQCRIDIDLYASRSGAVCGYPSQFGHGDAGSLYHSDNNV